MGVSVGALASLRAPEMAVAQSTCVTGNAPSFLPAHLTVDCASQKNFQLFSRNTTYMGLAGVVSMTFIKGRFGNYEAGNLFLFPWLKLKGQALGQAKIWGAVFPVSRTQVISATPIKDATLPVDEYFCRVLMQVPPSKFIGFTVDVPHSRLDAKNAWFTNVDKLAGGSSVGIDWTSSNLNNAWFGGSRWIPNSDTCGGNHWRQVIVDGVKRASSGAC